MKYFFLILLFLIFCQFAGYNQNRWVNQYYQELNGPGHHMHLSYDKGYLLSGWEEPNYPQYVWLLKTDINGSILWEKFIGDNINSSVLDRFKQNANGKIFLSGGIISTYGTDPVIIKLNACGEKEWCRVISTTSDNDFFRSIVTTQDGGCAAIIYGAYFPLYIYESGILKFSSTGDLDWQFYHQSPDDGVYNEDLSHLLLTPDSGFLMTGYCYYPDPETRILSWLHPYYVKVDSLGNFEWELVLHSETGGMGGMGISTIINPNQSYFYSCIRHFYHSDTLYTRRPGLVKFNLSGDVVGVYDLANGNYDWGALFSAVFINDSTLAGGAGWGYDGEEPQSRAIIFDTLGNIKDSLTLLNTGWLSKVAKTFDNKLLFYNTIEENGVFSNYLFKLNQYLEHDTIYSMPFTYDSLCPYQIVSDTIVPDDCGLIVGIEDGKTGGQEEGGGWGIELWPNPGSGLIHVSLSSRQSAACPGERSESGIGSRQSIDRFTIEVYDIFGRQAPTPALPHSGEGDWIGDVSALPPGLYLLVVKDGQTVIASAKFVVAR